MLGRERNTWTSGSDLRAHRRAARRDAAGRRTCSILERGAAALERPWPCTCSSLTLGGRIAAVSGRREVCVCARRTFELHDLSKSSLGADARLTHTRPLRTRRNGAIGSLFVSPVPPVQPVPTRHRSPHTRRDGRPDRSARPDRRQCTERAGRSERGVGRGGVARPAGSRACRLLPTHGA